MSETQTQHECLPMVLSRSNTTPTKSTNIHFNDLLPVGTVAGLLNEFYEILHYVTGDIKGTGLPQQRISFWIFSLVDDADLRFQL
jgi:hypothetical protein